MCIFCDIISEKIPSYKIYEDDDVVAFLDNAKDVDGHTLVVPKKHCENMLDCDDETLSKVMKVVKKISAQEAAETVHNFTKLPSVFFNKDI